MKTLGTFDLNCEPVEIVLHENERGDAWIVRARYVGGRVEGTEFHFDRIGGSLEATASSEICQTLAEYAEQVARGGAWKRYVDAA